MIPGSSLFRHYCIKGWSRTPSIYQSYRGSWILLKIRFDNTIANIFDKTDQYLSTGELSDDDKKLMSEVPKGITNVSSITKLPTGDVIIGQTFKAADGPKEQYFIKDADGNMSFKSRTASELAQLYHSQFDQSNLAPKNAARKIETVKNYTTP